MARKNKARKRSISADTVNTNNDAAPGPGPSQPARVVQRAKKKRTDDVAAPGESSSTIDDIISGVATQAMSTDDVDAGSVVGEQGDDIIAGLVRKVSEQQAVINRLTQHVDFLLSYLGIQGGAAVTPASGPASAVGAAATGGAGGGSASSSSSVQPASAVGAGSAAGGSAVVRPPSAPAGARAARAGGAGRQGAWHRNVFTDDIIREYLKPWQGREGKRALIRVAAGPTEKETLSLDLSAIRVPSLIVWAEQDAFLPMEAAERLERDFGGPTQLKTIPDCGHFLQEENPQEVARLMTAFLQEQEESNSR